jgi:hypothetical protein
MLVGSGILNRGSYEDLCLLGHKAMQSVESHSSVWRYMPLCLRIASCCFLACHILRPRRWRWYVRPKHQLTFNRLHGVISQKIRLIISIYCNRNTEINKQTRHLRILSIYFRQSKPLKVIIQFCWFCFKIHIGWCWNTKQCDMKAFVACLISFPETPSTIYFQPSLPVNPTLHHKPHPLARSVPWTSWMDGSPKRHNVSMLRTVPTAVWRHPTRFVSVWTHSSSLRSTTLFQLHCSHSVKWKHSSVHRIWKRRYWHTFQYLTCIGLQKFTKSLKTWRRTEAGTRNLPKTQQDCQPCTKTFVGNITVNRDLNWKGHIISSW